MKNNYKKGFTLAEVLIVFLIISFMLTAFAPLMTKKSSKKAKDPSCQSGTKWKTVEFTDPDTYNWEAPENATGNAKITLVGGGGRGGNTDVKRQDLGWDAEHKHHYKIYYATGGGGSSGAFSETLINNLTPNQIYNIIVGDGGEGTSVEQSDTVIASALAGNDGVDGSININPYQAHAGQGGTCQNNCQNGFNGCEGSVEIVLEVGSVNIGEISCTNYVGEDLKYGFGGGFGGGKSGDFCPSDKCSMGDFSSASDKDLNDSINGKPGGGYEQTYSDTNSIAGFGGGGGGFVIDIGDLPGIGALGGSGYAKIEYEVRCE